MQSKKERMNMDMTTVWAMVQTSMGQAQEQAASVMTAADYKAIAGCFAAAFAIAFGVMMAALSEGYAAAKACEGIARNPQASGAITRTMLIGQAVAESNSIYALVVALLILLNTVM